MCIHIFLPRLPLHYLQEPLPLSSIQHPLCDEPNRGVILNGREVRGFLNSGMSEIYEVKRKHFHMVEHLSTATLNLGCGYACTSNAGTLRELISKPMSEEFQN